MIFPPPCLGLLRFYHCPLQLLLRLADSEDRSSLSPLPEAASVLSVPEALAVLHHQPPHPSQLTRPSALGASLIFFVFLPISVLKEIKLRFGKINSLVIE